jgi:hypothetical protein
MEATFLLAGALPFVATCGGNDFSTFRPVVTRFLEGGEAGSKYHTGLAFRLRWAGVVK